MKIDVSSLAVERWAEEVHIQFLKSPKICGQVASHQPSLQSTKNPIDLVFYNIL